MEKKDFEKCQICGTTLGKVQFDSPVYCEKCVAAMFRLNLSPGQYLVAAKR